MCSNTFHVWYHKSIKALVALPNSYARSFGFAVIVLVKIREILSLGFNLLTQQLVVISLILMQLNVLNF